MRVQINIEEVNDNLNSIKSHLSYITEDATARVIGTLVENIQKKLDKALEISLACDRIEEVLANVESEEDSNEVIQMIDEAKSTYGHQPQFARLESKAHTLRSLAQNDDIE